MEATHNRENVAVLRAGTDPTRRQAGRRLPIAPVPPMFLAGPQNIGCQQPVRLPRRGLTREER